MTGHIEPKPAIIVDSREQLPYTFKGMPIDKDLTIRLFGVHWPQTTTLWPGSKRVSGKVLGFGFWEPYTGEVKHFFAAISHFNKIHSPFKSFSVYIEQDASKAS